ncbi:MAG: succinate dehydrogenase, hydrophobic membrane anchor protein [Gammaproteobacteria bacterium]|nr:succinate dehydrogenase, hydrophobic membrane anchor protein [Gammaproteobacteria bacterium]
MNAESTSAPPSPPGAGAATPAATPAANPARHASRHWWWQRLSALALIPLTLWFVFAILDAVGESHAAALAWLGRPGVAAALSVYLAAAFWHAQLGLQVVVEDYVAAERARANTLLALRIINSVAAGIAIGAVWLVAFAS